MEVNVQNGGRSIMKNDYGLLTFFVTFSRFLLQIEAISIVLSPHMKYDS